MSSTLSLFIDDLVLTLGRSKVEIPGTDNYRTATRRWSTSIERNPSVVVFPRSAQDVSKAVVLATKWAVPFTTVCGGHGTSGDSSIENGMLINMRPMNDVHVDSSRLTLTCGGGCLWSEIDQAADAHHMSSVGGTVQQTGVAGYTTGGGFGWLSGTKGLAIDNLLSAEVVLADGSIVQCSKTRETELFWAIRGAGHMFGVVTEFVFQGFHQPNKVFGGMVVFPPSPPAIKHLIEFANNMLLTTDGRTGMMCGFSTPPHLKKRVVFGCCFHDGPEDEALQIFGPLVNHPTIKPIKNGLKPMTMNEINGVLGMASAHQGRRVSKGAVFSPPLPPLAFQQVLAKYEDFVREIPEVGEIGASLFEFYHLDKVASIHETATAFAGRSGKHQNAMIVPCWQSPKYDERCKEFAREAMDIVRRATELGPDSGVEYQNYDGLGTPAAKTYGINYPRLCELKAQYDPKNVFGKRFGLPATTSIVPTTALPDLEFLRRPNSTSLPTSPCTNQKSPVISVAANVTDPLDRQVFLSCKNDTSVPVYTDPLDREAITPPSPLSSPSSLGSSSDISDVVQGMSVPLLKNHGVEHFIGTMTKINDIRVEINPLTTHV